MGGLLNNSTTETCCRSSYQLLEKFEILPDDELRQEALKLGVLVDGRWSREQLLAETLKAAACPPPPPAAKV